MDAYLDGAFSKEEMQAMKDRYDIQLADLAQRLTVVEEKQRTGTDTRQLKQKLSSKLNALLSGEAESEILYKTILDQITVFQDRHIELRFHELEQVFQFTG